MENERLYKSISDMNINITNRDRYEVSLIDYNEAFPGYKEIEVDGWDLYLNTLDYERVILDYRKIDK